MRRAITLCALLAAVACNQPAAPPAASTAPAAKALGIRPNGDTEIKPDLSQAPPELQKVFEHTDALERQRRDAVLAAETTFSWEQCAPILLERVEEATLDIRRER